MSRLKTTSFLSESLELTGTLRLEGGVRIDGKIEGSIYSKSTIYLGESAQINGNIVTENLVSAGAIQGEITAFDSVRIKYPGSLKGHISTSEIILDKEVFFDGRCTLTAPREITAPELKAPAIPKKPVRQRK